MGNKDEKSPMNNEEAQKEKAFSDGQDLMVMLETAGSRLEQSVSKDVFVEKGKLDSVICMDGRDVFGPGLNAVYVAGANILSMFDKSGKYIEDEKNREKVITDFASTLKKLGVTKIYSHSGCGAQSEYVKRRVAEGVKEEEAEQEAEAYYTNEAFENAGIEYEGEITVFPEDYHDEVAVYVDYAGGFNPGHRPDVFPKGFAVSAKNKSVELVDQDTVDFQVDFAVNIALDNKHGLGKMRFSKNDPFHIVVVANSEEELKEKTEYFKKKFPNKRVQVSGLIK